MTPTEKTMTENDIEAALATPDAFAKYLASLTPEQIDEYMKVISEKKNLDENVRKTLLRLFGIAREEAVKNVALYNERVLPLAHGIAVAQTLKEQIDELESLFRTL